MDVCSPVNVINNFLARTCLFASRHCAKSRSYPVTSCPNGLDAIRVRELLQLSNNELRCGCHPYESRIVLSSGTVLDGLLYRYLSSIHRSRKGLPYEHGQRSANRPAAPRTQSWYQECYRSERKSDKQERDDGTCHVQRPEWLTGKCEIPHDDGTRAATSSS